MPNKEHLEILMQGVEAWNEWRIANPEVIPDLSSFTHINGAIGGVLSIGGGHNYRGFNFSNTNFTNSSFSHVNLEEANLSEANLENANFSQGSFRRANFQGASFKKSDFQEADFSEANLSQADLRETDLEKAKFSKANLVQADLREAKLRGVDFSHADLRKADLSNTDLLKASFFEAILSESILFKTDFQQANLWGADLREVNLKEAKLWKANLGDANLSNADARNAQFGEADLSEANLSGADIRGALLLKTKALAANFEKTNFTGACIEDWHINSDTNLNDVNCDHIYLRYPKQERRPHTGSFAPGEFTKLFKKARETVDLIFFKGIDWQAFLISFQQLQIEAGNKVLSIQAIENKNDGACVIRVSVPSDLDKSQIEQYFKRKYQFAIKAKDKQYRKYLRERLKDKDDLIVSYREQMISIRQDNTKLIGIIKIMAEKENSKTENTFNISGSLGSVANQGNIASSGNQNNIGNAAGEAKAELKSIQHIHNYAPEQKQTLAEAATEIQHLLKQLEQTNPTATEAQQIEHINDETTPKFKKRVVGALQATSEAAIDEFVLENKYLKVAKAAIKGWMKPE